MQIQKITSSVSTYWRWALWHPLCRSKIILPHERRQLEG